MGRLTTNGCWNCVFWTGDERKAYADCRNENVYERKTPCYHGCPLWRPVQQLSRDQLLQSQTRG